MGKTADIFTLKAQFNPWGSIFDAEKSHADELTPSGLFMSSIST